MTDLLDPKTGVMRGIFAKDADDKLINIKVGELRVIERALQRGVRMTAFVLAASAENPAHIGSYRNLAVQLLEDHGIEPTPEGTFFTNQSAALADAQRKLFS